MNTIVIRSVDNVKTLFINGEAKQNERDGVAFRHTWKEFEGKILVGGLGMGLDLEYILTFPGVTKLTVVEIIPELIELYKNTRTLDPRLELICGDFFVQDESLYDVVYDTTS